MGKAKILCLHGFGTNANFMQKQAAGFVKTLSKQADFIFVDGPFLAPENFVVDQKVIDLIQGDHRSWLPHMRIQSLKQFVQQLDKIRAVFEKASDHFDGLLGFSQGAGAIHFLLKLKELGIIKWKVLENIKFTINMNGNHINLSLIKNNDIQLQIPSLHIISPPDFIYSKSILHTTQFKNPLIISHSYGHKFPKLGISQSKMLISFIRKYAGTIQKKKQDYEILSTSTL